MTPKTRKALEGSIRKWEGIIVGTHEDHADINCPLCRAYNTDKGCKGCPVKKSSGKDYCKGTPYEQWLRVTPDLDRRPTTPKQYRAALNMLRFLEGLRPSAKRASSR